MSFLIDPPMLVLSGIAIYMVGGVLGWNRHAKIVVGIGIVLTFLAFSSLLYLDIVRCVFPFFSGMLGSEFMLHTNITGLTKADVPGIVIVFLFLLYPVWLYSGYASALLTSKRLRRSREICSYADVKSRSLRMPLDYKVIRDPSPGKCVRDAVDALGGMSTVVKPGNKVLIKVNICGGVPEDKGTFTSLKVIDEVVDLVKKAGGEPTVADADMVWTHFWPAAQDERYVQWAKEKGVRLINLSDTRLVRFDFGEGSALGIENVSRELLDADVIISVPTMKTHLLTGVTLAMKNMYGTFPEIGKARYHKKRIEEVIYEVNKAFLPNLTIIDGTIGGEAVGPLSCRQIDFQTVVASFDVVAADSIACQLMGYSDPMGIDHIRIAHERGLGDASVRYDLKNLAYIHPAGKDGCWGLPALKVKCFYEWALEQLLQIPGWETFFNIGADFLLYDMSRLPVLRYLTPAALQLLNDAFMLSLEDEKDTDEDRARRRANLAIVSVVILTSLIGFYMDGYIWKASTMFDLGLLLAMGLALWCGKKMKTAHLAAVAVSSVALGAVVEYLLPLSGMFRYTGPSIPPLFAVAGWAVFMISIFGLSDLLRRWLSGLKILSAISDWRLAPLVITAAVFSAFLYWEGYIWVAGKAVLLMYAAMLVLGLWAARRNTIEWNVSVIVMGIALGGLMELMGSLSGLWVYRFNETLSTYIILAWGINACAVDGLVTLSGKELSEAVPDVKAEKSMGGGVKAETPGVVVTH